MSGSTLRRKFISVVSTYFDNNKYISCSMSAAEQLAGIQTAQFIVENLGTRWPGCKTNASFNRLKILKNYILIINISLIFKSRDKYILSCIVASQYIVWYDTMTQKQLYYILFCIFLLFNYKLIFFFLSFNNVFYNFIFLLLPYINDNYKYIAIPILYIITFVIVLK